MPHEKKNDDPQLLLLPTKDSFTFRELADGGMLVFGEVGSGKTSTISAQLAQSISENASCGGLVITELLPAAHEEA